MSEEYQPDVTYDEYPGFRSALLLNMSQYKPNYMTPKKRDIRDSVESLRLSIESMTPGTTPKGTEKRKNESNFNFCLSKDLLQRLEENSPYLAFTEEEKKVSSDIYLQGCGLEEKESENNDHFIYRNNFTIFSANEEKSSTIPSDPPFKIIPANIKENSNDNCYNHNTMNNKYISKETAEFINNNKRDQNIINSFNINSGSNQIGFLRGFEYKNPNNNNNNMRTVNQPCFINSRNETFNKFNLPFSNSISSSSIFNGGEKLNFNNEQGKISVNVNMYGKNGWICFFCKNFNYEIRIKCNRCSKSRNDLTTLNNNNDAVIVHHNNASFNKLFENPENSAIINSVNNPRNQVNPIINNGSSGKKKKPFVERVGDWNCFKCKNLNFSFRVMCNRCQLSKNESEKMNQINLKNLGNFGDTVNSDLNSDSSNEMT